MDRETILRLAREAGAEFAELPMTDAIVFSVEDRAWNSAALHRFAALVAAHEREACAALCEEREAYSMPIPCPDGVPGCSVAHYVPGSREKTARECAAAIRSRT